MKFLNRAFRAFTIAILFALTLPLAAPARQRVQRPGITNARTETRSAAVGLEETVQNLAREQSGPAWLAYSVPMAGEQRRVCCFSSEGDRCRCELEARNGNTFNSSDNGGVMLEAARNLRVFLRIEAGAVQKVRAFSEDCEVDTGGLPLTWLTGVTAADSVSYLSSFVAQAETGDSERRNSSRALMAIALHEDAAADAALERFIAAGQPRKIRKNAAFWLGAARGRRGFEVLKRAMRTDGDERFRKDAVFAIHVSREAESVDEVIRLAREDRSSRVRKQALFWLGQRAGKKAVAAITDVIENDPDTDIKKRAVFALSQLPGDEGVPLLMKVARTHRNPAVRKKAFFWLGQSGDPRALAFFEEVLTR